MKLAGWTEFRMGRHFKPTENGEERDWLWKTLLNTPDEISQIFQEKYISFSPWRKKHRKSYQDILKFLYSKATQSRILKSNTIPRAEQDTTTFCGHVSYTANKSHSALKS